MLSISSNSIRKKKKNPGNSQAQEVCTLNVEVEVLALSAAQRKPAIRLPPGVLERATAGDEEACRALYRHYHLRVFSFLARMLGGRRMDAEDLLQETFARVFQALPRFDPDGPANLSTWILTIAYRLCLNALRRKRELVPLSPGDLVVSEGPDDGLRERRLAAAVSAAVQGLPADQRAAFVLCDYQDLSYDEIAAVTRVSVGTVKSRLFRARRQVRAELKELIDA